MIKRLLFITVITLLATLTVQAKTFSYGQVKKMPLSVEKDYYIWRFLTQRSTTKCEIPEQKTQSCIQKENRFKCIYSEEKTRSKQK